MSESNDVHPTGGRKRVKQSAGFETSARKIVDKYRQGVPIKMNERTGMYGDFSEIGDYHDCQNRMLEANRQFMELPASVRSLCRNDVGVLLELASTEEGLEALKKAGLVPEGIPKAVVPPVGEQEVEEVESAQ